MQQIPTNLQNKHLTFNWCTNTNYNSTFIFCKIFLLIFLFHKWENNEEITNNQFLSPNFQAKETEKATIVPKCHKMVF